MRKILTAVALFAAALTAQAENLYVGAGFGLSRVPNGADETSAGLISDFGGTASSTHAKSVASLRIIGGYKLNENIAVEAGYTKTSKINISAAGTDASNVSYTASGNVRFSGLDISALFRPSVASGYNNFFAKVGAHSYKVKGSSTFFIGSTDYSGSNSYSGTGPMFGVGYNWKLDKYLDLRLAIDRINKIGGASDFNVTNFGIILIENY